MTSTLSVCPPRQCAGCMACFDICPKGAISIRDSVEWMDAIIDASKCVECNLCHAICQQNSPAELRPTISSYQGWANEDVRERASSGGFASAIMDAFIAGGGVAVSCKFDNGEFRFAVASDCETAKGFAGSKYVKSNPEGAYKAALNELRRDTRVLFIGLPCQVSAMRNFLKQRKQSDDKFYAIDLICHGTPSVELLRRALNEYGYDLSNLNDIRFRSNTRFGLRANETRIEPFDVVDRYSTAFLHGGCYTENCYSCHYACRERVSDLTLGDSWGTELFEEEAAGISLALVQTEKGAELLNSADVTLFPVDYENAVAHNHQLQHPSIMGKDRTIIFSKLDSGRSFKSAVFSAYPKYCTKQQLKGLLCRIGLRGASMNRMSYGILIITTHEDEYSSHHVTEQHNCPYRRRHGLFAPRGLKAVHMDGEMKGTQEMQER